MNQLPSPSRRPRFSSIAIVMIGVTLLAMGRLCFNEFSWWDDVNTVHHNPLLNPPTLATLHFYWLHAAYRVYIPLTYTVWATLAMAARVAPDPQGIALNPLIFHGANLLFHILAALVVCKILLLMRMNQWGVICGALVFAIHPIQVEAVAWVSGLKDVLSGLLVLVALWQYLRFAILDRLGRRSLTPLAICITALILAMLAKSSAATTPLAAIALDRWFVGRAWKRVFTSAGALILVALPFVVIASIAQSAGDLAPVPLWARPLIAGDSLAFYLAKLLWPINLCMDYGRTPWLVIRRGWLYYTWCAPAAIAFILFLLRKRARLLIAAAVIFVAGCLPTLGLSRFATQFFSTTTDHYLYWAMLGPAVAVAWILTEFHQPLLRGISVVAIASLAILCFHQGAFWEDDFALLEHAAQVNPRSFVAYNDLGNAYERELNPTMAASMFRLSVQAKPNYYLAHSNLAAALHQLGQINESILELRRSIALQRLQIPKLRQTWVVDLNRLALNLLEVGKPQQAAASLRESLESNPNQPDTIALLAHAESFSRHGTPATTAAAESPPP
jgi:tetratricopeptide (TPR) repeat protein